MALSPGKQIVLTADRTLMADYRLLFDGMLAASQTTVAPPMLLGPLIMPWPKRNGPAAAVAPLGLRRIEAALLRDGFTAEQLLVADQRQLAQAIGPETRVVGISSGEPAGLGMNTSTMTAVTGGRIYPEAMFRKLIAKVRRQIGRTRCNAKIVLGGPGAWQLADHPDARRELGIDHIITGYSEDNIADIFRRLLTGETLPSVITGQCQGTSNVPAIRGASTMGVVEISRGCGLGCGFCTIARVPMAHVPVETILADANTNVAAGNTSIAALSEDFFRFGGQGVQVNPPALIDLLTRLREISDLRLIQIDHANIISIAQFSDQQLQQVHDLLVGSSRHRYLWVNVGVESADGSLLEEMGAGGKVHRIGSANWGDACATQLRRLCQAGFFPMVSLLIGHPRETREQIQKTTAWVRGLADLRISIFPVLYAPVDGSPPPAVADLHRDHWELLSECYRLNFRWIPRMYWDNQAGAGVGVLKRLTLQAMGLGQIAQWKTLFAWHRWRAKP